MVSGLFIYFVDWVGNYGYGYGLFYDVIVWGGSVDFGFILDCLWFDVD